MNREFKRTDRIAEALRRELSIILQRESIDPRLPKFITLASLEVLKDLSHAKIYFTVFSEDPQQVAQILNAASGHLRKLLSSRVLLRSMPQLHFIHDASIENASRLSKLIATLNPEQPDEQSDE